MLNAKVDITVFPVSADRVWGVSRLVSVVVAIATSYTTATVDEAEWTLHACGFDRSEAFYTVR